MPFLGLSPGLSYETLPKLFGEGGEGGEGPHFGQHRSFRRGVSVENCCTPLDI